MDVLRFSYEGRSYQFWLKDRHSTPGNHLAEVVPASEVPRGLIEKFDPWAASCSDVPGYSPDRYVVFVDLV